MNLKYCYLTAYHHGEERHAQEVMHHLGIEWTTSEPQTLFDSWIFYNCTNVPDVLPPYLSKTEDQNG